jgi:cation transport ATPase
MSPHGKSKAAAKLLLATIAGIVSGVLILAVAHRLSQALSRWALGYGLLEPLDSWLWTRFVAWASVSLLAGWLIGRAFGRNALPVALLATATLVAVYCGSMLYLFDDAAFTMMRAYLFEFSVVAFVLSLSAFLVGRRHGA